MSVAATATVAGEARTGDGGSGQARLESYLRDRSRATGRDAPTVATLGTHDAFRSSPSPADQLVPQIHLTTGSILIGPVGILAGATSPCGRCLALRWQKLRTPDVRDALEAGRELHPVGVLPYLTGFALDAAWHLLASVTRGAASRSPDGSGDVYELNLRAVRVRRFRLRADPACGNCFRPRPDAEPYHLDLVRRRKQAPDRYRVRPLADYADLAVDAYVNPVCGALGASAMPDLACPTTAPVVGQIKLRSSTRLLDMPWSGHGDSFDASRLLAVFEGLERLAAAPRRNITRTVVAAFSDIQEYALDPRRCGVYAPSVYQAEPHLTPFTPDRALPWVWGYSLRNQKPILVPEGMAYYLTRGTGGGFVDECSNGCACGSCLEEAILFGLLELVERDAFLLGWYGKAQLPEIVPESCQSPHTRFMLDRIRLYGYDVRLFDNRIDLPIPVVTAVAVRRDGGPGTLCFASGAGLDPEDAVRGALCEIASYIPSLAYRVERRRDEIEEMARDFTKVVDLPDHAVLLGLPATAHHAEFLLAARTAAPLAELYQDWNRHRPGTLDLRDDLRACQDMVTTTGQDVIVVDQTGPEQARAGLNVACVIVPGLVPIDFGWTKQRALHLSRTRTAFRSAGWRHTDLEDADLHLVPHPFP